MVYELHYGVQYMSHGYRSNYSRKLVLEADTSDEAQTKVREIETKFIGECTVDFALVRAMDGVKIHR